MFRVKLATGDGAMGKKVGCLALQLPWKQMLFCLGGQGCSQSLVLSFVVGSFFCITLWHVCPMPGTRDANLRTMHFLLVPEKSPKQEEMPVTCVPRFPEEGLSTSASSRISLSLVPPA